MFSPLARVRQTLSGNLPPTSATSFWNWGYYHHCNHLLQLLESSPSFDDGASVDSHASSDVKVMQGKPNFRCKKVRGPIFRFYSSCQYDGAIVDSHVDAWGDAWQDPVLMRGWKPCFLCIVGYSFDARVKGPYFRCMAGYSFDARRLKASIFGFCSNLQPLWPLPLYYLLVHRETLKWMNEF